MARLMKGLDEFLERDQVNGVGADSDDPRGVSASWRLERMAGRLRDDDPAGLQLATDAARACLASNYQDCDPE